LHRVWVDVWVLSVHTALAIAALWATVLRARQVVRLPGKARLVTEEMMAGDAALAAVPEAERGAALDAWLARHGHRGPGESDVARPRFAELREVLWEDVRQARPGPAPAPLSRWRRCLGALLRPAYWLDERREWFRDACMRRWQALRARLLEEG